MRVPHTQTRSLRISLRRGDLSKATACAIVTAANDSLVGNLQVTLRLELCAPLCQRTVALRSTTHHCLLIPVPTPIIAANVLAVHLAQVRDS